MIHIPNVPCKYVDKFPTVIEFILLHKLIDNEYYRNYYLNNKDNGKYKILDNSAFELGESLDMDLLMEWAEKINANEIVIPDSYGDKEKTLKLMYEFLDKYPNCKFNLMAVPQGKNLKELEFCLYEMTSNDRVHCIGFNKLWRKSMNTIYGFFHQTVLSVNKEKHLLGVNKLFEWGLPFQHLFRSADSRILAQIVLGEEDIWDSELTEEQQKILNNLIYEVKAWRD